MSMQAMHKQFFIDAIIEARNPILSVFGVRRNLSSPRTH